MKPKPKPNELSNEAIALAIVHRQMDRLAKLQDRDPRPVPLADLRRERD